MTSPFTLKREIDELIREGKESLTTIMDKHGLNKEHRAYYYAMLEQMRRGWMKDVAEIAKKQAAEERERVGLRDDGCYTFHLDSNVRDMVAELTEQGAAAGMDDEEINALVQEYLSIAYKQGLH